MTGDRTMLVSGDERCDRDRTMLVSGDERCDRDRTMFVSGDERRDQGSDDVRQWERAGYAVSDSTL